jgi:hypothetical protein
LNLGDLVEHWTVVGAEQYLVAAKHRDTQLAGDTFLANAPTPARSERQTRRSSPDHRFASVTGGLRALDGERLIA